MIDLPSFLKGLLTRESLYLVGSVVSIASFILSIFVYVNVRKLRNVYKLRARGPALIKDLSKAASNLSKFMNVVMESGKKAVAERIIYGALDQIEKKANKDPLEIFMVAINNVKPMVEVKSRRVGGANYQVPVEVRPVRRMALAMRWLKESARKRGEKSMAARLANELLEASEGRGGAMKKRDEVHRMAEANKAFSHFRF